MPGTVQATSRDSFPQSGLIVDRAPGEAYEAASVFRSGDTVVLKVLIYNESDQEETFTISCGGLFVRYARFFPFTLPSEATGPPVMFQVPAEGTAWVDIPLTGIPATAGCGPIQLTLELLRPFADPAYANASWFIYRIESEPLPPMAPVWSEVLDDACVWAVITPLVGDALTACTNGVFSSGKFTYDSCNYYRRKSRAYYLSTLIDDTRSATGPLDVDCQDTSGYLMLCLAALGHSSSLHVLYAGEDEPEYVTNPICLVGKDAAVEANYSASDWVFHQVCLTGQFVRDPCAAQRRDLTGNAFYAPPGGRLPEEYPTVWHLEPYWQTPTGYSNGYLGLVDRLKGSSQPEQVKLHTFEVYIEEVR